MKVFIIAILMLASSLVRAETVALVQYNADLHFADYARNSAALFAYADEAVRNGAKMIVFPEGSHYGYASQDQYWCRPPMQRAGCEDVAQIAEPIPGGPTSQAWQRFAQTNTVYVVFNTPEVDGVFYYNTTAVFGPQGFVAKYRKRALYVYDEYYAEAGNLGPVAFTTPFGNFGLLICADANDPSKFTEYTARGIDTVIVPMDWDQDPNGRAGARPARTFFQAMARRTGARILVSDVSAWDGTGAYLPSHRERMRVGLSPIAVGVDGITYFETQTR
jgi:predicted amidohydrolase